MMTEGIVEKDEGTGIMTGIMTGAVTEIMTETMTETIGGGMVVTALITTTGGGDAIAITDITGIAEIAGSNQ